MERVTDYLIQDHERLQALLGASVRTLVFDVQAFAAFRAGLLRHIGVEEKILFPAARRANGGVALSRAGQLRLEHAAISSLLVPTPDAVLAGEIASILRGHDAMEEGEQGVYAECERLFTAEHSQELLESARVVPAVRVAPHFDGPPCYRTAESALAAAARTLAVKSGPSAR